MTARDPIVEKTRFLGTGMPAFTLAGLLGAWTLAAAHWDLVPRLHLLCWALGVATLSAALLVLVAGYRRALAAGLAVRAGWLSRFRWVSLAAGLAWGVGVPVFCQSADPLHQVFFALVTVGMVASVTMVLIVDRQALLLYGLPVLITLGFGFLLQPRASSVAVGVSLVLFLAVLLAMAGRIAGYLQDLDWGSLPSAAADDPLRGDGSRWRLAEEASGLGMWDWDLESDQIYCSPHWKRMLGRAEDRLCASLDEWRSRVHPDDWAVVQDALTRHLDGDASVKEVEYRMLASGGGYRWILARGQLVERTSAGAPKRLIGVGIDVTERKRAETELQIAAKVFDRQEGILITDADQVILRVNRACLDITGYERDELIGRTPRLFQSGRHDSSFYAAMWASLERTGSWHGEIWNRRKNGEIYPEWLTITALKGDEGQVTHYVATLHDISERKTAEEAILNLAFFDALTGLPNRRLLLDRLNHALIVSERTRRFGALLFIDLDHFKEINDSLGHAVGDLLLQEVGRRLRAAVRDVDTVARLGGDEFVVMLEDLSAQAGDAEVRAADVGNKILALLAQPYQLGGHGHNSTPSIGVVLFFGNATGTDVLLSRADMAMYRAKQSGRNALRFFDPTMQSSVDARIALKDDLRQGLGRNEFSLHYQPQMDAAGTVVGAEALLRWSRPERERVSPQEFIPIAEECGLILPLGQWVLESACKQLGAWSVRPGWSRLTLSINISPRQFRETNFVEQILAVLERTGANPDRLQLELDERLLLADPGPMLARMEALRARGVRFSLDHFGIGYSSLADLKGLPLSQLKLDQSFVHDLGKDPKAAAIARSVIALGHELGLEVVAAGVETEAQRAFLQAQHCHGFQGYLFGRPLTPDQLWSGLRV